MQLVNIGEAIKHVDKLTNNNLLIQYTEIDWKNAKGMRDIITHHYFDIDAEIIFNVIREKFPEMKLVLEKINNDLEKLV
jgi:uncharacterized protein with HEPN domain